MKTDESNKPHRGVAAYQRHRQQACYPVSQTITKKQAIGGAIICVNNRQWRRRQQAAWRSRGKRNQRISGGNNVARKHNHISSSGVAALHFCGISNIESAL